MKFIQIKMDNTGYHEWHKTQQSKVMFIKYKPEEKIRIILPLED